MDEKFVLKATAGHLFSVSGIFIPFFFFQTSNLYLDTKPLCFLGRGLVKLCRIIIL